jgi:hypothetical protein
MVATTSVALPDDAKYAAWANVIQAGFSFKQHPSMEFQQIECVIA